MSKLVRLYEKPESEMSESESVGYSLGTDTLIVVQLRGIHQLFMFNYFRGKGVGESDIYRKVKSLTIWNGIFEVNRSNEAFIWRVTHRNG